MFRQFAARSIAVAAMLAWATITPRRWSLRWRLSWGLLWRRSSLRPEFQLLVRSPLLAVLLRRWILRLPVLWRLLRLIVLRWRRIFRPPLRSELWLWIRSWLLRRAPLLGRAFWRALLETSARSAWAQYSGHGGVVRISTPHFGLGIGHWTQGDCDPMKSSSPAAGIHILKSHPRTTTDCLWAGRTGKSCNFWDSREEMRSLPHLNEGFRAPDRQTHRCSFLEDGKAAGNQDPTPVEGRVSCCVNLQYLRQRRQSWLGRRFQRRPRGLNIAARVMVLIPGEGPITTHPALAPHTATITHRNPTGATLAAATIRLTRGTTMDRRITEAADFPVAITPQVLAVAMATAIPEGTITRADIDRVTS
jgi:hypothetical protein